MWTLRITAGHWALRIVLSGCVILAVLAWHPVRAAGRLASDHPAGENLREGAHYFVDFHARGRPSFPGHVFIVYGELNARGGIVDAKVVGFTPDADRYSTAYFLPIPGLIGRRRADLTEPSTEIYRRHLSAAEFQRLTAKIREVRAARPSWHLIFSNCNDFVGEIAKSIGLVRPPSLLLPSVYVSLLRILNES